VLHTRLTERFSLRTPIVGAPMAGVAGGRLAAAISSAGGLGMIGVGSTASPDFVAEQGRVAASSGLPFGIGLMAWALETNAGQLDATIAARPALVSVSFGDYRQYIAPLRDAGIVVATQVGDLDEALTAADAGVEVIVARGSEAGGHGLNRVATFPLLQAVLEHVDIPVLAAGGIVTGRGLAAALAAGADGVWLGTAFLACPEAENTAAARAAVCAAGNDATIYTRVFDVAQGIPWPSPYGGRALANRFTERWHGREADLAADGAARDELSAAKAAGDYSVAYIYAGEGVGSVTHERPAAEVVASITAQAQELLGLK
jgi:nitronate monooxygenase